MKNESDPKRQLLWRRGLQKLQERGTEESPAHLDANQISDLLAGVAPKSAWRHLSRCEPCRLTVLLSSQTNAELPKTLPAKSAYRPAPLQRWAPAAAALLLASGAVWWVTRAPKPSRASAPQRAALLMPVRTQPLRLNTIAATRSLASLRIGHSSTRGLSFSRARHIRRPHRPRRIQLATSTVPASPTSTPSYIPRPSLAPAMQAGMTQLATRLRPAAPAKNLYSGLNPIPTAISAEKTESEIPASELPSPAVSLASSRQTGHGFFTPLRSLTRMGAPLLQAAWSEALASAKSSNMNFALASHEAEPANTLMAYPPDYAPRATTARRRGVVYRAAATKAAAASRWRIWRGELQRSLVGQRYWEPISAGSVRFLALAVEGRRLWAGSNDGRLFSTRDAGAHWRVLQLHNSAGQVVRAAITRLQMSGRTGELRAGHQRWRTQDSGIHWVPVH